MEIKGLDKEVEKLRLLAGGATNIVDTRSYMARYRYRVYDTSKMGTGCSHVDGIPHDESGIQVARAFRLTFYIVDGVVYAGTLTSLNNEGAVSNGFEVVTDSDSVEAIVKRDVVARCDGFDDNAIPAAAEAEELVRLCNELGLEVPAKVLDVLESTKRHEAEKLRERALDDLARAEAILGNEGEAFAIGKRGEICKGKTVELRVEDPEVSR